MCVLDMLTHHNIEDGFRSTPSGPPHVVVPKSRLGSAKVKAFTDFLFEILENKRRPRNSRSMVKTRKMRGG